MPKKVNSNKKFFPLHFVAAAVLLFAANFSAQGQSSGYGAHNVVWEEKLQRQVEFLADSLCHGRAAGSAGATEAAFWVARTFRKAGLLSIDGSYAKHFYAGGGIVGHNIVGIFPGSKKSPRSSYIIVGAHYDGLGRISGRLFPGADSNASGVVAMTSIAEMFASMKLLGRSYGKSIIFVAFDGNGLNLAGAEAFWRMIEKGELTDPLSGEAVTKDKIALMVNLDQLGSSLSPLKSGREDYLIMLGNSSLPFRDRGAITLCNLYYGSDLEITHSYYGSEDFTRIFYSLSDQRPFVKAGIPAVLFTSGITMRNNKTTDTPESLNYPVFRRRIILIYRWIEKLMYW